VRLAERFHQAPFAGEMGDYSAAQIMVIISALHEPEKPSGKPKGLKDQPKVSRSVMLELARKHNTDIVDRAESE
jgi:hypothetical protein